eukprot:8904202-Alexandrium_andersonii.AAC.1
MQARGAPARRAKAQHSSMPSERQCLSGENAGRDTHQCAAGAQHSSVLLERPRCAALSVLPRRQCGAALFRA